MSTGRPGFATKVIEGAITDLVELAGGEHDLISPRGGPHLGLTVIEAVFSLQSKPSATERVLRSYCDAAPALDWSIRFDQTAPLHGITALQSFLGPMSSDERCELLDWQCAPGSRSRKADVVVEVAECLHHYGLDHQADIADSTDLVSVERSIRAISGVGPTAWRNLLNLSGIRRVKPDTMVNRWVNAVLFDQVDRLTAAKLVEEAVLNLRASGAAFTSHEIDYLIWRDASGRPVFAEAV